MRPDGSFLSALYVSHASAYSVFKVRPYRSVYLTLLLGFFHGYALKGCLRVLEHSLKIGPVSGFVDLTLQRSLFAK